MKKAILFAALFISCQLSFAGLSPNGIITITDFRATFYNLNQIDISWNTIMENDVDHFEIQRSGDGSAFQDIISVPSKLKISTSDYQLEYEIRDANPLPGISYYRIKVVSKHGGNSLSSVIQINYTGSETGTRIYPTVIQNNTIFVESTKNLHSVRMEFFDLSGRKISETDLESLFGRQTVQVSKTGNLPTGTYLARLTADGQNLKNQLVIIQNH